MYARQYGERTLTLEASGGLIDAALVMRDDETDSYWSLMKGRALSGPLAGQPLEELPGSEKLPWSEWRERHPDTLVLSVRGREHDHTEPYANYFGSDEGFRGAEATDDRLPTKAPVYAFRLGERAYAAPFDAFAGGAAFAAGEASVFLHRPEGAAIFRSSHAVRGEGFVRRDGAWVEVGSGARFDPATGAWAGGEAGTGPSPLEGFDTFWYSWSLVHPETEVLGRD